MKKELLSRVNGFQQELERFSARWHQLKPANIDADADTKTCIKAIQNIKDRRTEFNDIVQRKDKLQYVFFWICYKPLARYKDILYYWKPHMDGYFHAQFQVSRSSLLKTNQGN